MELNPDPNQKRDFLGNVAIPLSEADRRAAELPRYRHAFVPISTSLRWGLVQTLISVVCLGCAIVLLVKEVRRVDATPLVFMQDDLNHLLAIRAQKITPSVPVLEAFVDYCAGNLHASVSGELLGVSRLRAIMDRKAISEIMTKVATSAPALREKRAVVTARVQYIDVSTPDRFVINRRLKKAYGSAYGFVQTTLANSSATSRKARWDFEIVFVARTDENPWGMFVTQWREREVSEPPLFIQPEARRPEDIMAVDK